MIKIDKSTCRALGNTFVCDVFKSEFKSPYIKSQLLYPDKFSLFGYIFLVGWLTYLFINSYTQKKEKEHKE